nr:MBL fold metallo-hydrolase [Neobacillus niacini]
MFLKKRSTFGEKNGVAYLNGEVKIQNFSLNVYCYVVDGVLIDTGSQSLHKYFEPFIDIADFDQVMMTHYHEDHTGCAAYIGKTKKVPMYLNEKTIEYCTQKADYPFYRQFFWGRRKPFHALAMPETFTSRNAAWDVIDTPGHAFDHKAFLNRNTGQLFTGERADQSDFSRRKYPNHYSIFGKSFNLRFSGSILQSCRVCRRWPSSANPKKGLFKIIGTGCVSST